MSLKMDSKKAKQKFIAALKQAGYEVEEFNDSIFVKTADTIKSFINNIENVASVITSGMDLVRFVAAGKAVLGLSLAGALTFILYKVGKGIFIKDSDIPEDAVPELTDSVNERTIYQDALLSIASKITGHTTPKLKADVRVELFLPEEDSIGILVTDRKKKYYFTLDYDQKREKFIVNNLKKLTGSELDAKFNTFFSRHQRAGIIGFTYDELDDLEYFILNEL